MLFIPWLTRGASEDSLRFTVADSQVFIVIDTEAKGKPIYNFISQLLFKSCDMKWLVAFET